MENYDYELANVYKIDDEIVVSKNILDAIKFWKSKRLPLYNKTEPTRTEELYRCKIPITDNVFREENINKYSEALEKAKQGLPIEKIFPELAENEDEKIRKDIIEHFNYEISDLLNKGEEFEAEVEELTKYVSWVKTKKK